MRFLYVALYVFSSLLIFSQEANSTTEGEIFTQVEESASFPGEINGFYQFLARHLRYPRNAQRAGIQGRVFVQFVVEKDGSITDVKIVKGIGGGCDEEATRVIKMMPNWIPAKQKGQPVRQMVIQNILFALNNSSNDQSPSGFEPNGDSLKPSSNQTADLGLLVIGLESYYYFGSREQNLFGLAHPKTGIKKFVDNYVFSLINNPKYFPSSISTYLQFTVFEDGRLGNFMLGEEMNKNDTLFIETIIKLGNWQPPSRARKQNTFKLEIKSADRIPDKEAHFPGGITAFNSYLKSKLRFPASAQRLYADGHVIVEFFVEIDGSITSARVIEGIGEAYDSEALRVIKGMPKWIPQTKNGIPLRQRIEQRVIFEVNLKQKVIKN